MNSEWNECESDYYGCITLVSCIILVVTLITAVIATLMEY